MADSCDAGICPIGLWRHAGKGDQVQRQRHFLDDPLDLPQIGEAGDEEPAGAGVGEGLPALDRFVDQRRVMRLRLDVQVCAGVDEKLVADGAADCLDALRLQRKRVQTPAAEDLVLEIAADRARRARRTTLSAPVRLSEYALSKSTVSGSSVESAMRFAFANAKSTGTPCPSDQPLASATGWLPVASALAPARMTAWALPTSQML